MGGRAGEDAGGPRAVQRSDRRPHRRPAAEAPTPAHDVRQSSFRKPADAGFTCGARELTRRAFVHSRVFLVAVWGSVVLNAGAGSRSELVGWRRAVAKIADLELLYVAIVAVPLMFPERFPERLVLLCLALLAALWPVRRLPRGRLTRPSGLDAPMLCLALMLP